MLPPPPTSTLFPYTTLFRSSSASAMSLRWNHSRRSEIVFNASGPLIGFFAIASTSSSPSCGFLSTKRWSVRSEEHTSELQSQSNLVCRLLLEKKKEKKSKKG